MRKTLILLSALLVFSVAAQTLAQDQTQSGKSSASTNSSEAERPKSEVERFLDDARSRGEIVLIRCLEDCGDKAIQGEVETGRALEMPKPEYPRLARMAHASGQVQVQLVIDVDGTVIAAAAVSGHPLLQAASVQAARQARFSVTKVDGNPVKVSGVITYNFVAQ
jgi:TonB family protein